MKQYTPPVVPLEVQPQLKDDVLAAHEELAGGKFEDFMDKGILEPLAEIRPGETRAIILGDSPEAGVDVLALPYGQAWKKSMAIRALVSHRLTNADGMTIVLPSNSIVSRFYTFSDEERNQIMAGNPWPFYEKQVRTVERELMPYGQNVGPVALKGYSQGGLTVVGMAAVGSPELDVRHVGSVEAPNIERTTKELNKAFRKSGGPAQQIDAVEDAHLPMLSKALSMPKLMVDYARFGIADFSNDNNRILKNIMTDPHYAELVIEALSQYDRVVINAGYIAGSHLFDPAATTAITDERFNLDFYAEGPGNHKHPTGDNAVAVALMQNR